MLCRRLLALLSRSPNPLRPSLPSYSKLISPVPPASVFEMRAPRETSEMMASSSSMDDERHLLAPFEYIRKMPGKQIRSKLSLAFNEWLHCPQDKLEHIMEIVEMLHNASLLIDDIEDSSVLRRGLPVTHSIYGTPRTINSANYVYFVALDKCSRLGHETAISIFTDSLLELHRGQGKELFWRDTVKCPTEDEYEEMVVQKTGGLFLLTVHLMQLFSEQPGDFDHLLRNMALYFQIRDDYLNLCSVEMAAAKTVAEDLTEGKFSYPVIRAIQGGRDDDEVLNILRQRTQDVTVKRYCVRLIQERGAFDATLARLSALYDDIVSDIARLGGNATLTQVLAALQKDIVQSSTCINSA